MNTDIRLKIGQADHRKTKKLIRLAGEESYRCLIRLWMQIAKDHPEGTTPMTAEDIELDAGWNGEPGGLLGPLVESGYFDEVENGFLPHDWSEHQSWAVHAKARSERSRNAASVRWASRGHAASKDIDAPSKENDAQRNAPSPTPLPSPIPSPIQKNKRDSLTKEIHEIITNKHGFKILMINWDWAPLDRLEIPDKWVLDLYDTVFDPKAPNSVSRYIEWLQGRNAAKNIINNYPALDLVVKNSPSAKEARGNAVIKAELARLRGERSG